MPHHMIGRRTRTEDASWHRYLPTGSLLLIYIPAKVCGFCDTRTHVPSRRGWWWQRVKVAGLSLPVEASSCQACYRLQKARGRRAGCASGAADEEPVIEHGLPHRPGRCPKCDSLLEQEPGYSRCRWGCGKLWPIRGASLVRQTEYELSSGLRLIA